MNDRQLGRLVRVVRHRARITQADLAARAHVGRWKVIDVEAGRLGDLRLDELERCLGALEIRLLLNASYRGAAGDRLIDETHARLVGAMTGLLQRHGWEVRVEVSYSSYGERGSIDVVAWHATSRTLLVIEVKSELASVEGTLRPFDVKCRLAAQVVRERFGWHARHVGRVLVLPEDRTCRRQVERHAGALRASLPEGSRALRRWLRQPDGAIGGIWFLSDVGSVDRTRNPSTIRRVRKAPPRSA